MKAYKFFPQDKNYILKEAQEATRQELLRQMIDTVRTQYLALHNPLGLVDDTIRFICSYDRYYTGGLEELYEILAGIYRYQFGTNQLEFLFDGTTHYEKYCNEWSQTFRQWILQFCLRKSFLKAALEVTIFFPEDATKTTMAGNRMKLFLRSEFDLTFNTRKGYPALKTA